MIEYQIEARDPSAQRDVFQAMRRGFACRCPQCGQGRLFGSYLRAVPHCTVCGEALDRHRADDLPAYVVIVIVGHVVVGLNLAFEQAANWPLWLHFAIWPLLSLALALAMLQPVKGALIGYQWALRLHGFDPHGDADERLLRRDSPGAGS